MSRYPQIATPTRKFYQVSFKRSGKAWHCAIANKAIGKFAKDLRADDSEESALRKNRYSIKRILSIIL